jgi:hypothetical protein
MRNDLKCKIRGMYGKASCSAALVIVVLGVAAISSHAQGYGDQQSGQLDPPSRVARVSVLSGNVSLQPASVEQFNVAEPNYPMTTGDRIYADVGANAEMQTGQLAVRLGQQTDLTVTAMTDELAQFGLAQGSVHLRSYNVYQGETVEVDTPNVAVTVLQSGDVRVDVDPVNDVTVVTVLSGQVQVNGNGIEQVMEPGERLRLSGGNPVYAQLIGGARPDGLDRFSVARDGIYLNAYAEEGQYINPGTIGGEDLSVYGSWENDGDNGAVWYPANVAYDWQPYRNGRWTWVAPWGWTWIEAEPWGFAPFHYGRWNRFGNRWGWIPGPVVVRPIYSPALVVFVGGNNFAGGVTAWFPLGPREVYTPWYHVSDRYVNRVNVSNIYDRNVAEVRNVYNQRTVVNTYVNVQNRSYANRGVATVAMSQDNFARGGRADQATLRVDPRQLAQAQVLPHPLVTPERSMVAAAPAKALPPVQTRPVLASHEDNRVGPGAGSLGRGNAPAQGNGQPPAAVVRQQPVVQQPALPQQQPRQAPSQLKCPGGCPEDQPQRPTAPMQMPQQTVQQQQVPQQQMHCPGGCPGDVPPGRSVTPAQPQRPLFNQAVPPSPRPSFDQQRQAIQATDPGRPLSPQQLNNLRQNQPAGQPQQREAPHPAAPAPPPAPRNDMQKGKEQNPH